MIDKNRIYRTRDGREVRIYATDGVNGRVHGAIKLKRGWTIQSWENDGKWMPKDESICDLIEVRPRHKRTVWLNVHPDNEYAAFGERAEADEVAYERIACIKVDLDFCEGDGL